MTTQQRITITHINEDMAAARFIASQARRAATLAALKANALERAGELALLGRFQESKRVLALNYFVED